MNYLKILYRFIISKFNLSDEKESLRSISASIAKNVEFKGTNLWILICAVFIASLGLNVNSTAVIIGAMLISPLMGPIMGIGLSLGIYDFGLYRKSIINYGIATIVGLLASMLYFYISPLSEAHSEILARTQPNIYDVLIAFFGGFAGIIATTSKQKGNVIPGVAIATALMPPLCTAGFGLATGQFSYFFGAAYLYLINTVFIALSTLLAVRILHLPKLKKVDEDDSKKMKQYITLVTILTLLPSIYFGYNLIKNTRMERKAKEFVLKESKLANEYLLDKNIDLKNKTISLTYAGTAIPDSTVNSLQDKFISYGFDTSEYTLHISQGFKEILEREKKQESLLKASLSDADKLRIQMDSMSYYQRMTPALFNEIKSLYPQINQFSITNSIIATDSIPENYLLCYIKSGKSIATNDKSKIKDWISSRLGKENIRVITE